MAEAWGISTAKVLDWIRAGELRAVNAATNVGGRPRYLIDQVDIKAFEARRAVVPPSAPGRRRRAPDDVIEFF
jgi:hypothetical protein